MKKMENDKQYGDTVVYRYGDTEFEGKHLLYQQLTSSSFIPCDMGCYCEKEGVRPFEGVR